MENDHLRKIWETGLFTKISITHSKGADDQGFFRSIVLYYPKDEESWNKYTTEHQTLLSGEYKGKFGAELQDGRMKPDRLIENEHVLFGE